MLEKGALQDLPLVLYQLSQRGDSVGLVAQLAGLSPIYYMILVLLQTMPDDIYIHVSSVHRKGRSVTEAGNVASVGCASSTDALIQSSKRVQPSRV